jgi:hypothetical protein
LEKKDEEPALEAKMHGLIKQTDEILDSKHNEEVLVSVFRVLKDIC